jgi:hypothetical protein
VVLVLVVVVVVVVVVIAAVLKLQPPLGPVTPLPARAQSKQLWSAHEPRQHHAYATMGLANTYALATL